MAISHKNGVALTGLSAVNGVTSISALNGVSATLGGGSAPPAFGAEIGRFNEQTNSSTTVLTLANAVSAGRRLVVVVLHRDSHAVSSITDSAGNTYTKDLSTNLAWSSGQNQTEIWSCHVANPLSVSNTVTITWAAFYFSHKGAALFALDGVAATSHVDQNISNDNGFGSTPSATASTTAANTALIGLTATTNAVTYGSSAWTVSGSVHEFGGNRFYYFYQNATSAGSKNPSGSLSASAQSGTAWVAYKA